MVSAHIGGNTIPISLSGFNTSAIEIDNNICQLLKIYIELYKLKVKVICGDFTKNIKGIKHDVVFSDPPWGGTGYKKFAKLPLYLSGIRLTDVVNRMKNKTKVIILKVPFNYDIEFFMKNNTFSRISQLFKIERFYMIVLVTEKLNLF